MYKAVQNCNNCGADLTLDDMRGTNCPYCKVVYPHHSQAAQHAQMAGMMMNQMIGQQAQIQNQWRGAFGVPPVGPTPMAGPAGHPHPGQPGSPYGDPNQMMHAHMAHAQRMSRNITLVVMVSMIGVVVLIGAVVALAMLF